MNTLEKRGYVKAGNYTPESSVEHPVAVTQLAEEFARAGGDITQTFSFYSRDIGTPEGCSLTVSIHKVSILFFLIPVLVQRDKPSIL